MQKWDHALEDLKRLQQFIDESTFGSSLQTLQVITAQWIWSRSIFSLIKPSFDITVLQYFWKFTQICKKIAANAKLFLLLFLGVASLKLLRIHNKNNFAFIYCKFLVNLCKYLLRNSTFFQTTTAFLKPIWKDIQEKILIWSYFFIDLTLEF